MLLTLQAQDGMAHGEARAITLHCLHPLTRLTPVLEELLASIGSQ